MMIRFVYNMNPVKLNNDLSFASTFRSSLTGFKCLYSFEVTAVDFHRQNALCINFGKKIMLNKITMRLYDSDFKPKFTQLATWISLILE